MLGRQNWHAGVRIGTPGSEPAGGGSIGGWAGRRGAGIPIVAMRTTLSFRSHARFLVWVSANGTLIRAPMCDSLVRALGTIRHNVHPCVTLSYRPLARHPRTDIRALIRVSCTVPMRDSLMRIPMCDTLIRAPCTTLYIRASAHDTTPPLGITGRGGARSGSPSVLNLCPGPCLFPCRGCGRRTIRSGGLAARAAAARSRAVASAGRPA